MRIPLRTFNLWLTKLQKAYNFDDYLENEYLLIEEQWKEHSNQILESEKWSMVFAKECLPQQEETSLNQEEEEVEQY